MIDRTSTSDIPAQSTREAKASDGVRALQACPKLKNTSDSVTLDLAAIRELGKYKQFVLWKSVLRDGKVTKVPIAPDGRPASVSDPSTWFSFETAHEAYVKNIGDGIGFVFTESDPFVGIDLDNCLDDEGRPTEAAVRIVAEIASYTETSPSGRGLHIIAKGTLPSGRRRMKGVECYSQGRFFTLTGRWWPDAPA